MKTLFICSCCLIALTVWNVGFAEPHPRSGTDAYAIQSAPAEHAAQPDSAGHPVFLVKQVGGTEPLLAKAKTLADEAGLGFTVSALALAGSPSEKAYQKGFEANSDTAQTRGTYVLHLFIDHNEGAYACLFDSSQAKPLKCSGAYGGMTGYTRSSVGMLPTSLVKPHSGYKIGLHIASGTNRDANFDEEALDIVLNQMKEALTNAMKKVRTAK
jgi:hypothetical protein